MSDKLKEFARETIDKLVKQRLKDLSADELIAVLPPETLEALVRRCSFA